MNVKKRIIKWQIQKFGRKATYFAYSKLYRDTNKKVEDSIMVAGTARSGTTWLASIISSQIPCRIMFEPFHSEKVEAFRKFRYFQYMRPAERNDELLSFCYSIFSGQIRDDWIDRHVDVIRPKKRLIKEIRANLFLKWIHTRFNEIPIIFIIRNPCAVVASRLKLGWSTDADIAPFLAQPNLIDDFLYDKLNIIEKARTPEQKHAIVWCVSNLVPLKQFEANELTLVFYENMCLQPDLEIEKIFTGIQQGYRDSVFAALNQPSTTTSPNSAVVMGSNTLTGWQKELSSQQISNIFDVVCAFGLEHLYGESVIPLN